MSATETNKFVSRCLFALKHPRTCSLLFFLDVKIKTRFRLMLIQYVTQFGEGKSVNAKIQDDVKTYINL